MTAAVACSVTDLGMTGWCSKGEHSRCPCPCHHGAEAGQLAMFAVTR